MNGVWRWVAVGLASFLLGGGITSLTGRAQVNALRSEILIAQTSYQSAIDMQRVEISRMSERQVWMETMICLLAASENIPCVPPTH